MKSKGINDNQLTIAAGLSVGLIGKAKSSGKGMSAVNIEKILLAYPDLSAEWLLTGKGEMRKTKRITSGVCADGEHTPDTDTTNKGKQNIPENNGNSSIISQLLDTIKQQAEEIGKLKVLIAELEKRICSADDAHTTATAG